jgi:hypothetical protein
VWWLTWRQYRLHIIVTVALLAAVGGLLLAHGLATADFRAGYPACPGAAEPACDEFTTGLNERYKDMYAWLGWLPVLPVIIGVFWGAPLLAREYERGTHRLAWTQSVSRGRWLAVKLGGLAAVVVLCGLALGAMVSGWLSVFDGTDHANEDFGNGGMFVITGVVPGAWFLLLFAAGAAAGALWRRVLPAMATTVAVFALMLYLFVQNRPYYAEPEQLVLTGTSVSLPRDAIISGSEWTDPAGNSIGDGKSPLGVAECADLARREAYWPCLYEAGYRQRVIFQPVERYWRFQWTETGILAGLALALGALTAAVTLRRRL